MLNERSQRAAITRAAPRTTESRIGEIYVRLTITGIGTPDRDGRTVLTCQ